MRKIFWVLIWVGSFGFGQNFFETAPQEYEEENPQTSFFQTHTEYDQPDQGLDEIGNPGNPVPVDQEKYILSLIGICLGAVFILKKPKFC